MFREIIHMKVNIYVSILVILFFVFFVAFSLQRKLVFPGGSQMVSTPKDFMWEYEDINFDVDGETTNAWYIPAPDSRGVVLFSHGNAGNISDRLGSVSVFHDMGFDVMIYDYGGYGKSTGKSSEKRCYKDIRAVWRNLVVDRGIDPKKIVLYGRSLGGGVNADLAAEVSPGAIILESTFTSAVDLGSEIFPFLPVRMLLMHRFKTSDKIEKFTAPILIIHSPDDEIIPYHHGEDLFETAPSPKLFLQITGGHNDGWMDSRTVYIKGIKDFLDEYFPE